MVFKTEQEEQAEEFVEEIKRLLASKDGVIYELYTDVSKPNVISPSTVSNRHAIVEASFYNVGDPEGIFTPKEWRYIGELNADVDTHNQSMYTDATVQSSIEFHKTFK